MVELNSLQSSNVWKYIGINYLRPVFDSDFFAFATLVKQGRQLLTGTVEVFDEDNRIIAIGITTYVRKQEIPNT